MQSDLLHPTDQELLLTADGELPSRRIAEVRAHLAACWECRTRMAEVEGTIADFTRANRQQLDPKLTAIAGPRALLKARLAELAAVPAGAAWRRHLHLSFPVRMAVGVCAALIVAVIVGQFVFGYHILPRTWNAAASPERGVEPDRALTPGATRQVSVGAVCSMQHEEVVREVPTNLRQEVFQEYGIANARANDYEIDYLIAPGLGGTDDIRNLWPEPEGSKVWNSRVKDALEEQLHQMVCAGKIDLSTAQNDIATDWIAAYKKYFHTELPLAGRPDVLGLMGKSYSTLSQMVFVTELATRKPSFLGCRFCGI
jgi:anti-sigma factor RsiW